MFVGRQMADASNEIKQQNMPYNKNANFRYRILDRCFQQRGKRWLGKDLVEEVSRCLSEEHDIKNGVSLRSIEGDIKAMRQIGAPIKGGSAGNPGYCYEDPKYSLYHSTLSDEDWLAIRKAMLLLRQFKGLPHYPELEKTLRKVEGGLRLLGKEGWESVQFEWNELAQGRQWLERLYDAIEKRRSIKMEYQPFTESEPNQYTVHPYLLKEYRNRWFLFGHAVEPDAIYSFALDRICSVQTAEDTVFKYNPTFHPQEWFRDIIGVTRYRDRPVTEIVFRTTARLGPYLDTKPLHPSQRLLEKSETGWRFSLSLIPNYELCSELMRFGKALHVETPPDLLREYAAV